MIFLAVSGLGGGIVLILDPSGDLIKLPLSLLQHNPFGSYFIPGMVLFLLLGIFPGLVFIALLCGPEFKWLKTINIYPGQKAAWTAALYSGITLILWIDVQIYLIGGGHILQFIYGLLGVLIVILTLLPSVKEYYSLVLKN
jgi:hypothetical protein